MKGKLETGALMKVLVNRERGIRKNDVMSLVAFFESPYSTRCLPLPIPALLTYPTLDRKKRLSPMPWKRCTRWGLSNPR